MITPETSQMLTFFCFGYVVPEICLSSGTVPILRLSVFRLVFICCRSAGQRS